MKHRSTIFITGAGTTTTLSVIKGLRKQKQFPVRIISGDMDDFVSGRYLSDAFYKIPPPSSPSFIPEIMAIVKKEHVDLLIPIVDYEFPAFVSHRKDFQNIGCTVVISSKETIDTCIDKFKTVKFFDSIGILTPKSFAPEQVRNRTMHYPLFIKPSRMGRASADAYKVETKADLEYYRLRIDRPIIQEFIQGQEITTDAINTLEGQYVFSVSRKRLQAKNGVSVKGKIFSDHALTEHIKRITEGLHIIGPCNIQCFATEKGYVFTEVNPRFSGAGAMSLHSGFNSPHILLALYKGFPVDPGKIHIRTISVLRYWEEIVIDEKKVRVPAVLKLPK